MPRYPHREAKPRAGASTWARNSSLLAVLAVREETALGAYDPETDLPDADMAADGGLCYATSESGCYKTVLYVYDSNQNRMHRWLSASRFMPV
ncbi:MAG: hypothetical protein ACLS3C_11010 [Oscillospiraceae bacterium]